MSQIEQPRISAFSEIRRVPPKIYFQGVTRKAVAEFCGTFTLCLFGIGSIAQVVLGELQGLNQDVSNLPIH